MIFLTGDTHRNELSRVFSFCKKLDVADTFIILGDVGINWYLDSSDICLEKKLGQLPPFVFCIKGNHECSRYEDLGYEKKWAEEVNGWVWQRYAGTAFAIDGETYEIEGKSFLVLGGAYSVDKWYRLQNKWKWFPEEQMTDEEKTFALETCEKIKWKIDHVLSHTCPWKYIPTEWFISGVDQNTVDNTMEMWLVAVEKHLDYKGWWCGHYHGEKDIDKIHFLFRSIVGLE